MVAQASKESVRLIVGVRFFFLAIFIPVIDTFTLYMYLPVWVVGGC